MPLRNRSIPTFVSAGLWPRLKIAFSGGRTGLGLAVLFAAALGVHFYFATLNWHSGFMPGHEFRQTHTALIAYYIDKENNFSPVYSTPLFGKPWAVPLEFPLYEWSVVLLSRAVGVPHFEAARAVSLTCFYLTLPAVFLLLGQFALSVPRRLLVLTPILVCPVYIFYSRAFLMESMVLMFSVWFLALFVRTMQERRCLWLVLCALCGTGSALVKSTTFFVWLLPAALYGAWCLWGDVRRSAGWAAVGRTMAWGLGAAAGPGVAVYWWVKFTDALKEHHPSAYIFTSKNLTGGNYGMYDLAARFSPATWKTLLERWHEAIVAPWIIGFVVVAGVIISSRDRWRILGSAGLFLAAQSLFPFAYAFQEYYFYACAVFLLCALGFALLGVVDSRLPSWIRALVVVATLGALLGNYFRVYHTVQSVWANGGSGLTAVLNDCTPRNCVIIVVGDDWSPIIPYYSQRRALMIRTGLEGDPSYLERAFHDLEGEEVSVLVMARSQRSNRELARRIAARFDLDPDPVFSHPDADVYVSRIYSEGILYRIRPPVGHYDQVVPRAASAAPVPAPRPPPVIPPVTDRSAYQMVSPAPSRCQFTFGYAKADFEGAEVIGMHPNSSIWVPPPAGARQIIWEYGIFPGAYEREGDKTDGVEFIVVGETPDGRRREVYRRVLDPATVPSDRGRQQAVIPYEPAAGETLVFLTRPNKTPNFDWAYARRIEVK